MSKCLPYSCTAEQV